MTEDNLTDNRGAHLKTYGEFYDDVERETREINRLDRGDDL